MSKLIISDLVIVEHSIKDFRKHLKISQTELANKIGVSRQTISSIERYKYLPSLITAFKIAKVFNQDIEDIFDIKIIKNGGF